VTLTPGTRLGPYEIVAFVAAGGMGEVYRARDTRLGRTVAVKIVSSALSREPAARRRFEHEAQLAAQLDHPRIGAVHDVGHDGDVDYIVMEFIEGRSLADRLMSGPLSPKELIGVAIEIAAALGYAHRRGVVHRDLKPGNILLTSAGVKVIDFGLGLLRHGQPGAEQAAMLQTEPLARPTHMSLSAPPGSSPQSGFRVFLEITEPTSSRSAQCYTRWRRAGEHSMASRLPI
jgi:eukaryotic-like serine/threonine-protein kinase